MKESERAMENIHKKINEGEQQTPKNKTLRRWKTWKRFISPGYINLITFPRIASAYKVNITAFYIEVLSNTKVYRLLFGEN